ncbi:MAG: sodium:proton antiporter [Deltaproteobacteria bacterium]|nr:sodium:proton antiporter [Deltaproteobacteria bacterium]
MHLLQKARSAKGLVQAASKEQIPASSAKPGNVNDANTHFDKKNSHENTAKSNGEAESKQGGEQGENSLGSILPLWSVIPFIGILLSIAIIPLFAPAFWHHHFGKISAAWALALGAPFIAVYGKEGFQAILHTYLIDYIPFIILLWGLFTAAGGIVIRGSLKGTPAVNTIMLAIATIVASWIGTTGAAMLFIRPVIRANKHRKSKSHVIIFFIFLVANIGGSLTPLGDPPLFLGFLHKVPFFWTTKHVLVEMSFVAILLLLLFFGIDTLLYRRENGPGTRHVRKDDEEEKIPLGVAGLHNLIFLAGIVGAVLMSGAVRINSIHVYGHVRLEPQNLLRDTIILIMGLLSWVTTKKTLRKENGFTWFPIKEVAYLFAGIFMTIVPALAILRAGEHGALAGLIRAVDKPWHYFWITGGLSSFLDNAPTYLTFFNTALGKLGASEEQVRAMLGYVSGVAANPEFIEMLTAISCGAVFMGANTYIGNAPNFMVKSIAEESEIKMPSFFGYMAWSGMILIPLFLITTLVFFR